MKDKLRNTVKTVKLREDADINNGCVLAIGSFDGVHIGHRAMLFSLVEEAKRKSLPAAVFTFDIFDSPKGDCGLLALYEDKLALLKEAGAEVVFSAPFGAVKDVSALDFAEKLVLDTFGAKSIVCGYDFRFGKGREGDAEFLKRQLSNRSVSVITPQAVLRDGAPVSSTLVRGLIAKGEIERANALLGRHFTFKGEVVHGKQLGRTLGFPTVNQIYPKNLQLAAFGVYAVACVIEGKRFYGVANIGVKPTVSDKSEPMCETHIFDYCGDLYGKDIRIELIAYLRGEQRFSSLDELKAQVERDKESARMILMKECN